MHAQTVASEPVPSSGAPAGDWPQLAAIGLIAGVLVLLAFASGGYFPAATAAGGAASFVGLGLLLLVRPPRGGLPARALVALGALAGLAAWSAISAGWSPVPDTPLLDMQRTMLYLALFALGLLAAEGGGARGAGVLVWTLLGVIVIVCGAGLLSRLEPGIVHAAPVLAGVADTRLSYPLGYWNALGALATIGAVLAIGLSADPRAPRVARAPAAGAAVGLLVAMYLSLSRGAWLAFLAGLVALIVLSRHRWTLLASLAVVGCGTVAALIAPRLLSIGSTVSTDAGFPTRRDDGVTIAIAVIMGLVAAAQARIAGIVLAPGTRVAAVRAWRLALAGAGAVIVVVVLAGLLVRNGAGDRVTSAAVSDTSSFVSRQWDDFLSPAPAPVDQGTARLLSTTGSRGDTYRVALDGFAAQPLRGEGAGSFEVRFMRTRHVVEKLRDAHSLPLQTLSELGLVGFALLLAFVGAVAVALARAVGGRGALRRSQSAAVGAAFVVWLVHACLDWDWEMPALTGTALVLGATLFAAARRRPKAPAAA